MTRGSTYLTILDTNAPQLYAEVFKTGKKLLKELYEAHNASEVQKGSLAETRSTWPS